MQLLDELTNTTSPSRTIPWEAFQRCYIFNRTLRNMSLLTPCGRILAHAKQQVVSFRERLGVNVCVFKIGVTTTPAARFQSYCCEMNFSIMWIVFLGNDLALYAKTSSCTTFSLNGSPIRGVTSLLILLTVTHLLLLLGLDVGQKRPRRIKVENELLHAGIGLSSNQS